VAAVEVWQIDLSRGPRASAASLSAAERARAARLLGAGQAERWMAARSALRELLGERLGVAPAAVELAAGEHGKPEVPGAALRFNVSHTGEFALIALAGREVGVDVERLDRTSRAVERTLTPGERATAPGHEELLRIWCRKEALAKAIGGGLGWAPERFDTTAPGPYTLADVPVRAGYVAALAVAGDALEVIMRERL